MVKSFEQVLEEIRDKRILVANRGITARRITRSIREVLHAISVVTVTDIDKTAPFTAGAQELIMLGENPRVCVEIDEFLGLKSADKACDYGASYRSLIAFGTARIVEEAEDKLRALQLLMEKYAGRSFDFSRRSIQGVAVIEIRIEELTGKQDLNRS